MAQRSDTSNAAVTAGPAPPIAYIAGLAGWAVPGLGHLILRRWGRAAVYFLCVIALASAGLLLHGIVFPPTTADPFDFLGFLANVGTGLLYLAARSLNGYADVSRAAGDYGTRFFATAGVLNLISAIEAFEIGCGKRR